MSVKSEVSVNERIYDICFKACGNTPPSDDATRNDFDAISCLNECKAGIINLVMKKIYEPNESNKLKPAYTSPGRKNLKRFKKRLNKIGKPFKNALQRKEKEYDLVSI